MALQDDVDFLEVFIMCERNSHMMTTLKKVTFVTLIKNETKVIRKSLYAYKILL